MSKERGQKYFEMFKAWESTMSDSDFAAIVYAPTGCLNKGQIKKLSGLSDEALKRNSQVKQVLKELDDRLRLKGVLPPLSEKGKQSQHAPILYNQKATSNACDVQRKAQLEAENHNLRVKVEFLENEVKLLKSKLSANAETLEAIDDLQVFRLCPSS